MLEAAAFGKELFRFLTHSFRLFIELIFVFALQFVGSERKRYIQKLSHQSDVRETFVYVSERAKTTISS